MLLLIGTFMPLIEVATSYLSTLHSIALLGEGGGCINGISVDKWTIYPYPWSTNYQHRSIDNFAFM